MVYVSKLAVAIAILVLGVLSVALVEGADKSVISGPYCIKKSVDTDYNKNAARLMDILVGETQHKYRSMDHEDYRYYHSYPNKDLGSVLGGGFCKGHLTKWGCDTCLGDARHKIKSRYDRTYEANIQLADCSLWFRKIVNH
ncbi:hypothetical protein LINGRAHAP2_LOCUS16324 [Linum grandiflorum]